MISEQKKYLEWDITKGDYSGDGSEITPNMKKKQFRYPTAYIATIAAAISLLVFWVMV